MLELKSKPKIGEVTNPRLELATITLFSGQWLKFILNVYSYILDLSCSQPLTQKNLLQWVKVSAERQKLVKCLGEVFCAKPFRKHRHQLIPLHTANKTQGTA